MATGHYARKVMQDGFSCISAHSDQIKDQTYFLWGIPQKFLEHILFPLHDITKEEVKQVARDYNFTHFDDKKESFGVCFAPDGDYLSYMKASLPDVAKKIQPGNFVTQSGKVVGRHKGLIHYTIGQRKDLELYTDEELYVQKIVPEKNKVIVGPEASLLCDSILLRDYEIHNPEALKAEKLEIKTTYRGKTTSGKAKVVGPHLKVSFDQPAKAMAPGQTAVLYKEGVLVAGGFIV